MDDDDLKRRRVQTGELGGAGRGATRSARPAARATFASACGRALALIAWCLDGLCDDQRRDGKESAECAMFDAVDVAPIVCDRVSGSHL